MRRLLFAPGSDRQGVSATRLCWQAVQRSAWGGGGGAGGGRRSRWSRPMCLDPGQAQGASPRPLSAIELPLGGARHRAGDCLHPFLFIKPAAADRGLDLRHALDHLFAYHARFYAIALKPVAGGRWRRLNDAAAGGGGVRRGGGIYHRLRPPSCCRWCFRPCSHAMLMCVPAGLNELTVSALLWSAAPRRWAWRCLSLEDSGLGAEAARRGGGGNGFWCWR